MRKNTAKKIKLMAKEQQSPCPLKNALQKPAGNECWVNLFLSVNYYL